ncbi:S53 family peptidase [Occallatibacter riparius]|uniref:S53 family peptidase n=1 Tax=Occallatibacter riparius TaxID=1002689 RepID=A0A9J7BQL1_9BACT|nr:S53 family peptidase [Occallatibacter riparius]UWZ84976.1 S53 family peptidase [Occallatibacter riparius]
MAGKKQTTHVLLPGSKRAKDPNAKKVGAVDPNKRIDVTIDLAGPALPGPDEAVGRTLTPEELTATYGASQADADKVAKTLKKFGLKVEEVLLATRSMRVSGTIAQMERAFKPGLVLMHSPTQGQYRGRQGTLEIPAELKGIVKGVLGLDTREMARRKRAAATAAKASSLAPLTPADLEQRYKFPPGDGTGQTIAIAEFGGGYFAADAAAYCTKFGRPVPTIQAVAVDAPAYTYQQILALPPNLRKEQLDNSVEVMMDVQIVAGLCPKANILVYFSTFDQQGWVDLLDKVIAARPVTLSVSWGLPEDDSSWSANARNAIDNRLNAARLLGITTCIAAGDDGSGDEETDGRAHVDFPGSSPNTLCVGGTMLKKSKSKVSEVVWWDKPGTRSGGGGATGGGVSVIYPRPKWQTVKVKSLNSKSIDGRVVPDISALAGEPYYDLIFTGQDSPNGGTSASAPLWAALIARVNAQLPATKQQRFLTPLLYGNAPNGKPVGKNVTRDVTSGNNASHPDPGKGYHAAAGFDAASGWGVPDGGKLLSTLTVI